MLGIGSGTMSQNPAVHQPSEAGTKGSIIDFAGLFAGFRGFAPGPTHSSDTA